MSVVRVENLIKMGKTVKNVLAAGIVEMMILGVRSVKQDSLRLLLNPFAWIVLLESLSMLRAPTSV